MSSFDQFNSLAHSIVDSHDNAHESDAHLLPSSRTVKTRVLTALAVFVAVQAVVAFLVSIRSKRRAAQRRAQRPDVYPSIKFDDLELERGDDHIKLYMEGHSLLVDMIRSIDDAHQYIYLETFIIVDDDTGRQLRDALERAVARNVQVYVMYDWLLSSRLPEGWFSRAINLIPFKPIEANLSAVNPANLLRDHRKIVVIDGELAFIGGYNFGDEFMSWRDSHVRIRGRSVGDIENAFTDFWNMHRPMLSPKLPNTPGRSWDPHMTVHRNDPTLGIFPIRGMYMEAIDRAEHNIWITNAYFVPDRAFRLALIEAARRGVDVRIMLPAFSNHPLSDVLAHGVFDELLGAGVRIHLYRDFMVHAKTCTIDRRWSSVGTANLDRWSMLGNYEINLEIRSQAFAENMQEMFELDVLNCVEVELDAWTRRPLHWKASERTLRSLSPLM